MKGILFIFGMMLYFIPSMVALSRKRNNTYIILILNIFTGWTIIGWLILLIWAFSVDRETLNTIKNNQYSRTSSHNKYNNRSRIKLPKKICQKCKNYVDYDYNSCPKCGERFVFISKY